MCTGSIIKKNMLEDLWQEAVYVITIYYGKFRKRKILTVYMIRLFGKAIENPDKNYLVIVPEQFTMQTQKISVLRIQKAGS